MSVTEQIAEAKRLIAYLEPPRGEPSTIFKQLEDIQTIYRALCVAESRINALEFVLKKLLTDCEPDDDGRLYAPRGRTYDEAVAVINPEKSRTNPGGAEQ